jgi:hypothetical protein
MALTLAKDSVMTGMVLQKNIAGLVTVRNGSTSTAATAAGTGDNTTKNGISIDRQAINMPMSAVAAVLADATLASGANLKVTFTISHSDDNSSFTTYQTTSAQTTLTALGGASTKSGETRCAVNLSGAKRYVRLDHIPDLSAAGTDTSLTRAVWIFAGEDRLASVA